MPSVKISELVQSANLNVNPSDSYFVVVDSDTNTTNKISAKSVGDTLYANNALYVGSGGVVLTNVIAQFTGVDGSFVQMSMQNQNATGSADYVVTADTGTNANSYIDLGINNSQYADPTFSAMKPYDGYLYVHGPADLSASGNLVIGTASDAANIVLISSGTQAANIMAYINKNGTLWNAPFTANGGLYFQDGTLQRSAANANVISINAYTSAVYDAVNSAVTQISSNTLYQFGINASQNSSIQIAAANTVGINAYAYAAFAVANTAVQNTALIQLQTVQLSGNLIANSVGQGIFVDKFTSNSATFTQNMVVLGNLSANTLLGNIFFSNVTTITTQSNSILWTTQAGSVTQQTAQLWYYANTQSLILDTDIPGDRLSISKVLFFRGFNTTGATIPANSFVRLIAGVTANQIPLLALADATSAANATVAGFVKVAIANGAYGFAYSQGIVEDLDTRSLGSTGDIIFLSTTPGRASNVAPTDGANTVVQLGRIINSDATQGKLFVQNQLRQAYGRPNGALLYAFANNITASNTLNINESIGRLNVSSSIYAANGIINKSSEYPSSQTAITINMATDTWVKCNVGASLGITVSNFVPGSEVTVIATNPNTGGGANRTITHGCSGLNSSVGALTFTLGGTTTAFLKYRCLDGDLANTYVQVTYS